ncbi:MAG: BatA domain-containing protein [Spirochaetia bacterium]|nr:BatA domain-containing protein [Spirochaetota bacterium]MCX8096206.1 BatA domain-containing protein [Spirochaetota bacterium]MDW8112922.1 BatA domain-containing protein [Spirochaetia bacterium]
MIEVINPFLWGLAFSLIPIFIYVYKLITRKTFILPTLKVIKEEKKSLGFNLNIEILKMLLRALIITLIVFIFSQPIISNVQDEEKSNLILIDTTYSSRNNFYSYTRYLKEYLSSLPQEEEIIILDTSGIEISGIRDEVKEKLRLYLPRVSKIDSKFLKRVKELSSSKRIIVLTDGQESFVKSVKDLGIQNFQIVKFPYSIPYGTIRFSIWNRVGRIVDVKYEIVTKEECLAEIVLLSANRSKLLFSSKVEGKRVGEVSVEGGNGLAFIKGILISSHKTNEFIEPIYFFDERVEIVSSERITNLEVAFRSLGFEIARNSEVKLIIAKYLNSDLLRNSILIPSGYDAKFLVRGQNIFSSPNQDRSIKMVDYFSTMSIISFTNLNLPNEIEFYGFNGTPVVAYDSRNNNLILLGLLNYQDPSLPWFVKELTELFLVGTKYSFEDNMLHSIETNITGVNVKYLIAKTPEDEISGLVENISGQVSDRISLGLVVFILLVGVMVLERVI